MPHVEDNTVYSLKDIVERFIAEHERRHDRDEARSEVRQTEHQDSHDREHKMTQEAMDKAASDLKDRLEGMNEIRHQLNEQATTFMRADTAEAKIGTVQAKMESEINSVEKSLGVLADRVINLEKTTTAQSGRSSGISATIAWIVTGISVAVMLVGLFLTLAGR